MNEQGEATGLNRKVAAGETLYRTVIEQWIVYDEVMGRHRPSSAAFKDGVTGQLSVDIASKTTPLECLRRRPRHVAVASFGAAFPISHGYDVVEDPVFDEHGIINPAHALVVDPSGDKAMKPADARKLAKECSWAIPPKPFE